MTVTAPPSAFCTLCGAPLQEDQEWCLECGAGRTIIRRPPDWRLAALSMLLIVLVVIGGFALALRRLTDTTAPAATPGRVSATTHARPRGHTGSTTQSTAALTTSGTAGGFATWPVGLDGWTVVLALHSSESAAVAYARQIASRGISDLGVLDTDQHPAMRPPHAWEVFSGRFPTEALAEAAASQLAGRGLRSAHAVEVQRPGAP